MGSVCTMRLIVVVKKTKSSTMLNEVRQSYSTCDLKAILVRNMRNLSRFSLMSSKGKTVEVPFITPKYKHTLTSLINEETCLLFFNFFPPSLLDYFSTYSHLSNNRGGEAKIAKSLNVEAGINVEVGKYL